MKKAILATKIGMTQIFNADGVLVPVTVLELSLIHIQMCIRDSMCTDPTHIQISDPGHVEGNTVFTYLDAFSKPCLLYTSRCV